LMMSSRVTEKEIVETRCGSFSGSKLLMSRHPPLAVRPRAAGSLVISRSAAWVSLFPFYRRHFVSEHFPFFMLRRDCHMNNEFVLTAAGLPLRGGLSRGGCSGEIVAQRLQLLDLPISGLSAPESCPRSRFRRGREPTCSPITSSNNWGRGAGVFVLHPLCRENRSNVPPIDPDATALERFCFPPRS